jgi:transcriptional regulator with PAS, ATPase and Fis domain
MNQDLKEFLAETSLGNSANLKSLTNNIERHLVAHTLYNNEGSKMYAAKMLGISESSIRRKE